jgi:hypothetical protein
MIPKMGDFSDLSIFNQEIPGLVNIENAIEAMAIKFVDLPIEKGDFP